MKKTSSNPQIPALGGILKFLLDCFDIRRDGNPLTHKQVERLAKEKDLSQESLEKVARSVLDAIYQQLSGETTAAGLTGQVMEEWAQNPQRMSGLAVDEQGTVHLAKDQILKDMIEFCWRHQFLLAGLKDCRGTNGALRYWLSGFVIPFVTSTLVDYYFTGNHPESGMPGGRLWYLPQIEGTPDPCNPHRIVMPSQQVLLWWEGLLGRSLENFSKQLCGTTSDPDNARRQIAAWRNEAKPPDSETIRRWTNQTWEYQGLFQEEPDRPIEERWSKCREFLAGKGMIADSDWIKAAEDSPFDPVRDLAKRYRGERLEQEIPPFHDFPFKRFFESPDPVREGLPVEALIQRVKTRWRPPTRLELHSRLMLGRAMNLAWNACSKTLGGKSAFDLIRWAGCSYNHFMKICVKSETLSAQDGMRIHCQIADPADPGFHPIAAMLDERYWLGLPAYLRMWIRGEVLFKDGTTPNPP